MRSNFLLHSADGNTAPAGITFCESGKNVDGEYHTQPEMIFWSSPKVTRTGMDCVKKTRRQILYLTPYVRTQNRHWPTGIILERLLAVNAKVATVQGSIPVSSDRVESEVAADEAVLNNIHKKKKNPIKYP
jgi:hypothetical protein